MNYAGFYNDLIAAPVYQIIRAKASLLPPLLYACLEFTKAITDAKAGEANPQALQMSIWLLIYWLKPDIKTKEDIETILNNNNLNEIYSLNIPPEVVAFIESQPSFFRLLDIVFTSKFYTKTLVPLIFCGTDPSIGHATTFLIVSILLAQSGLVNPPTEEYPVNNFQAALWMWVEKIKPHLTQEDLKELKSFLEYANLDKEYSIEPNLL